MKNSELLMFVGSILVLGMVRQQQIRNAVRDVYSVAVKQFPGYRILSCNQIVVDNQQKAYEFAFKSGATSVPEDMYIKLFGKEQCFKTLDANHALTMKSAFNLMVHYAAGSLYAQDANLESIIAALSSVKNQIHNIGNIDTSQWFPLEKQTFDYLIQKYQGSL